MGWDGRDKLHYRVGAMGMGRQQIVVGNDKNIRNQVRVGTPVGQLSEWYLHMYG